MCSPMSESRHREDFSYVTVWKCPPTGTRAEGKGRTRKRLRPFFSAYRLIPPSAGVSLAHVRALPRRTRGDTGFTRTADWHHRLPPRLWLSASGRAPRQRLGFYFRPASTAVNLAVRSVPTVPTIVIIATAMPAAIRPYSMAVAPDSSEKNRERKLFMQCLLSNRHIHHSPGAVGLIWRERRT